MPPEQARKNNRTVKKTYNDMENPFVNLWVITVTFFMGVIGWLLLGSCTVSRQPLPSNPVIQYIYAPDGKTYRFKTDSRHTLKADNSLIIEEEADKAVFPQYYPQQPVRQWQRRR